MANLLCRYITSLSAFPQKFNIKEKGLPKSFVKTHYRLEAGITVTVATGVFACYN